MLGILLTLLLACILIPVVVLLLLSPGKPEPILDESGNPLLGSLSEKFYTHLNGAKQGMFIKSQDASHPVLLYLHGGMPDYFLTHRYPTGLEDIFTVVWWEQRGSGMSYNPGSKPETVTLEGMIADTLELADTLRRRFGHEKIYLMGHSGGTFIGIQAAARAPELFNAYIGVAQMSHQRESERLAYEYMLRQFKADGNRGMVRKLEAAKVTREGDIPAVYRRLRDPTMHSLGIGTTHDMKSVVTGLLLPSLACREYSLREKANTWLAKSRSGISILWDSMSATDLAQVEPAFDLPVYFIHGLYDYTVNYSLAKAYFEKLKAPIKGFYTFEHSAHSPLFEEPEKLQMILREDVLEWTNHLADEK